jgi:hypothetical protein
MHNAYPQKISVATYIIFKFSEEKNLLKIQTAYKRIKNCVEIIHKVVIKCHNMHTNGTRT